MIQKTHIENFLRINSISVSAPDDEIRHALLSARWTDRDTEIAISLLRGAVTEDSTDTQSSSNMLYSDERVSPHAISSLFKVHVQVPQYTFVRKALEEEERKNSSALRITFAVLLSLTIAVALFFTVMYVFRMGPFYSPV